ncbi:MAG: hypothetical protein CL395_08495 [Acidiferrobacteraceae bacterium]|jgi:alkane 1-monooxygenase|nr:hypothetical protein [Acidiferrobacteraceae bacterium]
MDARLTRLKDAHASTETGACYWLSIITPLVTLAGILYGQPAAGAILVLVIYPLIDLALGRGGRTQNTLTGGTGPRLLLYLHVLLHTSVVAALCWRAGGDGNTTSTWLAMLSAGICSGSSGIIVAHELGHSTVHRIDAWLARWNLLLTLYVHFTIEHNRHHHPAVATEDDPASAPRARHLWQQLAYTVPAQLKSAWSLAKRSGQQRRINLVLRGLLAQAVLVLALWQSLSGIVAVAFVGQALVSIFLLEYVNYIRHYGLRRQRGEAITEQHSWQTEARWSRWTLLALTRHPAHHLHPGQHYWQLRPYPNAPTLPAGYYALFWPALIPSWWDRLMEPLLDCDDNTT